MSDASQQPSIPAWVRACLFVEAVLFPLAFLFLAGSIARKFFLPLGRPVLGESSLPGVIGKLVGFLVHPETIPQGTARVQIYRLLGVVLVKPVLLFFFNLSCALFIALRQRLSYRPKSVREIAIPIAGTTILLLLPLSEHLPAWFGHPFAYRSAFQPAILGLTALLTLIGGGLALHGILFLRRNFSVFVEVRDVVLTGPYRIIRHPLYAGEILLCAGLVLTIPSVFSLIVLALLVIFQYVRARMEEAHLAEASVEYAARMAVTGMFFPPLLPPALAHRVRSRALRMPLPVRVVGSLAVAAAVVAGLGLLVVDRNPAGARTGPPGTAIGAAPDREVSVPGTGLPAPAGDGAALPAKPDEKTIRALLRAAEDARTKRDWPRAIQIYQAVVDDVPEIPDGHLFLGFCLLQSGNVEGARAAYETALERDPESPEAANGLAWTLIEMPGSAKRAVELAELAVKQEPTAYYLDTLARACLKAGDCARAAEAADRAHTAMPEDENFRQLVEDVQKACGGESGAAPASGP